jgi:hypothetical protein
MILCMGLFLKIISKPPSPSLISSGPAPRMALGGTAAWRSNPLLAVSGEQGSSKTVLSKILRALVDPNAAPVRSIPREERDLFIAASNGHLVAFDNLSDLPHWISAERGRVESMH